MDMTNERETTLFSPAVNSSSEVNALMGWGKLNRVKDGAECSVTPWPLYPEERVPGTHCAGPRAGLGPVKRKISCPCQES
jgi:hypothetical protein